MCIEHDGIGWLPDQINLAISDPVNLTIYTFHELQNFNPRILRLSECCMDRTGGDWLDRGKDEKEERRKERKKEKRQLPSQPETAWPAAACACSIAAAPESENSISVRPSFSPLFFLSLDFFSAISDPARKSADIPGIRPSGASNCGSADAPHSQLPGGTGFKPRSNLRAAKNAKNPMSARPNISYFYHLKIRRSKNFMPS